MEVSQLLRLYQARGWGALPPEDLLLYLKRLEHSGYQPGREGRKGYAGRIWTVGREMAQAGQRGCACCPLRVLLSFYGEENKGKIQIESLLPTSLPAPYLSFYSLDIF